MNGLSFKYKMVFVFCLFWLVLFLLIVLNIDPFTTLFNSKMTVLDIMIYSSICYVFFVLRNSFLSKKKNLINIPNWAFLPGQLEIWTKIKQNKQACHLDEIPGCYGEFGLEPSNPIPTNGMHGSHIYLKKLRVKNSSLEINYVRSGSLSHPKIHDLLDKYEITSKNDEMRFIYISPYHYTTSKKAPSGFYLM